jgi:hypothetical protein
MKGKNAIRAKVSWFGALRTCESLTLALGNAVFSGRVEELTDQLSLPASRLANL